MIDTYTFGTIQIDGVRYTHDVIITQKGAESWWRKEGHKVSFEDIEKIIKEKPEVLIIGIGYSGYMKVPPEVKEKLENSGIELIIEKTKDACNTYNQTKDKKTTAAALHITC